jgi:hypothetical protein
MVRLRNARASHADGDDDPTARTRRKGASCSGQRIMKTPPITEKNIMSKTVAVEENKVEKRKLRADSNAEWLCSSQLFCLTLRPTKEEFRKPFVDYVGKVFKENPDCGCFKVVPPKGWRPRKEEYDFSDVHIGAPIKQHAFGKSGAYMCILEEQRSMNGAVFQSMASHVNREPPKRKMAGDDMMERSFWSSIMVNPPVYGADTPLSLFDAKLPWGWNLRELNCLFKEYDVPEIPGVTSPMTYFGMWKAFFAWHKEDLDLYSINYLHTGAPKVWYCVPPSESEKFDAMAEQLFPEAAANCSEFLRHKDIMISPSLLKSHNIKYEKAIQYPGEFIVLNTSAYHSGFNLGFNCAEAVNFALPQWLEIGRDCSQCECGALADGVSLDMSIFFPGLYDSSSSGSEESSDEDNETSEGDDSSSQDEMSSEDDTSSGEVESDDDASRDSCDDKSQSTSRSDLEDNILSFSDEESESKGELTIENKGKSAGIKRRGRPPGSRNKTRRLTFSGERPNRARSGLRDSTNVINISGNDFTNLKVAQQDSSNLPREAVHITWGPVADPMPVALVTKSGKSRRFTLVHRLDRQASRPDSAWFGVLEKDGDGLYCPKPDTILVQFGSASLPKVVNVRTEWACPESRRRGGWKLLSKEARIVM